MSVDLLLVEPPMRYQPMLPNGMGYVWNALKPLGLNVRVADMNIAYFHRMHNPSLWSVEAGFDLWTKQAWVSRECQGMIDSVAVDLLSLEPKILGISASETSQAWTNLMVATIRRLTPELPIIVGGYSCEYDYAARQNVPDFDYLCVRDAELTLPSLVIALLGGNRPRDLPGVLSKYDTPGRAWVDAPLPDDIDALGFPKYEWGPGLATYPGPAPIMMTRGCGWGRCHFCSEIFAYRQRQPDKVAEEMAWLIEHDKNIFVFGDSSLASNHEILMALCHEIIERGLSCWFNGQYHANKNSNGETFTLLKKAGCGNLTFGVDGWNDHTLRLQRKSSNMEMVETNLRACRMAGINTSVNMVIGVPGETEDDIDEAIDNIIRLKDYITNFQNLNCLILSAGSDYYLEPEKYDIEFRRDKAELYQEHPASIPTEDWYSEGPYIDGKIRESRRKRIAKAIIEAGINLTGYARWQAEID